MPWQKAYLILNGSQLILNPVRPALPIWLAPSGESNLGVFEFSRKELLQFLFSSIAL